MIIGIIAVLITFFILKNFWKEIIGMAFFGAFVVLMAIIFGLFGGSADVMLKIIIAVVAVVVVGGAVLGNLFDGIISRIFNR